MHGWRGDGREDILSDVPDDQWVAEPAVNSQCWALVRRPSGYGSGKPYRCPKPRRQWRQGIESPYMCCFSHRGREAEARALRQQLVS